MALKLRRGTNAARLGVTFAAGEIVSTTDTKQIFLGDGSTAGGLPVTGERFSAEAFGVTYDGTTDDTSALNAAIAAAAAAAGGGTVVMQGGSLKITSTVNIPESVKVVGTGGHRATTLVKAFNGDLITMGTLSQLCDVNLSCVGGTYTGRGIYVNDGYSHQIHRVRVYQSEGPCLEFADDMGGGANVTAFEGETTSPLTVPALKMRVTGVNASPKFFEGLWLPGGLIDIQDAGQSLSINGFYATNLLTDSGTALAYFSNGRFASVAATTTITGGNLCFSAVSFSGPVALSSASGCHFSACVYGTGITEDAATCSGNTFDSLGDSYTPAWSQISGTGPVLNNGTLTGYYTRSGNACTVSARLVLGSGSTHGDTTGAWTLTLPFRGHASRDQRGLPVFLSVGGTTYMVNGTVGADSDLLTMSYGGQTVRGGWPAAWSATDSIDVNFTYMVK